MRAWTPLELLGLAAAACASTVAVGYLAIALRRDLAAWRR